MGIYASSEPLIDDRRLEHIQEIITSRVPGLDETTFVTALVEPEDRPREAHFLLVTPHPKEPMRSAGDDVALVSRMMFSEWRAEEKRRDRFVTSEPDLAMLVFASLAKQHTADLQNKRELNDP